MVRGIHFPRGLSEGSHEWDETVDLLRRYVVQETITPFREIGRSLAYGLLGALASGIGVVFLLVAGLRALQTETGSAFSGNWTFAPYLLMALAAACSIAALGMFSLRRAKRS